MYFILDILLRGHNRTSPELPRGRYQKDPASVVYRIGDGREPCPFPVKAAERRYRGRHRHSPRPTTCVRLARAVIGSAAAAARVGRPLLRGRRGTRQVRGSRPSAPVFPYVLRKSFVEPLLSLARL